MKKVKQLDQQKNLGMSHLHVKVKMNELRKSAIFQLWVKLWSKVAGTEIRLESLYWPPFERKTSKTIFLGNSKGRGLT